MSDSSVIEIDLPAIGRNMRLLREVVGSDCRLCPMVKADGYGLGAVRISRTLVAAGADMLAVYTPGQATELFQAALGVPILVLMPVREVSRVDELYRGFICGKLHLTVHDEDQLRQLIHLAERFGAAIPLHLEVDTGMSRGGCSVSDAPKLLQRIATHPRLKLAGLFTHFASAEADTSFTDEQHTAFEELIASNEQHIPDDCLIHAANTFTTFRHERFHHSMVRVGLAWAGYCTEEMAGPELLAKGEELEPTITWASSIVQIKSIPAKTPVGYGSKWRAKRDSVIGLIPVGYADGYPVTAGTPKRRPGQHTTGASVGVLAEGMNTSAVQYAPVIGAVNMDQITVDLTDIVDALGDARELKVGTRIELISSDPDAPNHLPRLARSCGTFAHEMICRLNPRLRRVYRTISPEEIVPATAGAVA